MGARVSVQDRETYPLMEEYGVDLAPGTLTSLSLQMVKITRHRYSGCQAISWQDSQYGDQLSEQHKSDYRQGLTSQRCKHNTVIIRAGTASVCVRGAVSSRPSSSSVAAPTPCLRRER